MKIKGLFKNKKPSKEKLKSKFKFKKLICGYAIINNKIKKRSKTTPRFFNSNSKQIFT